MDYPSRSIVTALVGISALGPGSMPIPAQATVDLEPGIADVGLVFLAHKPPGIQPARFAAPATLDRSEGVQMTIVGYVDETWALWSIPSYVCSGDSGGGIFLNPHPTVASGDVLVANVSDGGRDCRRHNNNNRLDTHSIQKWINDTGVTN